MSTSRQQPAPASEDGRPALSVIVVNYQSWPEVEALVGSLEAEPEFRAGRLQVIVIDNASAGSPPEHLLQLPPPAFRLLLRGENGGFAVGVNAGWRLARGHWLLVLNPDVEIEKGLIGQVIRRIERLSARPEGPPGMIGFGLRNADGSTQGSVGRFPTLLRTIREQFIPRSRRKYQAGWRIRQGSVDWVTGACMLLNGRMMAEVGGMDEDFFLYHEEVALCRVAHERGWGVEFDPSIAVTHRHPLQDRPISPKMRAIIRHSKLLYFRKHLPRWQFLGLSGIVSLEAALCGAIAKILGHPVEARAWRLIGELSREFRAGREPRGRGVLDRAESALSEQPERLRATLGPHRGRDRKEHSELGGKTLSRPPGPGQDRPD